MPDIQKDEPTDPARRLEPLLANIAEYRSDSRMLRTLAAQTTQQVSDEVLLRVEEISDDVRSDIARLSALEQALDASSVGGHHMMRVLLTLVATLIGLLALLGTASYAQAQPVPGEEHCVVNVRADDRLNVRAKPRANARIVTSLNYGTCGITVTGQCRGSWCPVEDGHSEGWVHSRYIAMVSPALYCVTGVPVGDRLNLRAYPSPSSRILVRLARQQCDIAFLPYRVGNWQKVRVRGYEGWVNRRYVSGE
jgi:SH3-like domain-containing protein